MNIMNKFLFLVAVVTFAGCDPTIKSTDLSTDNASLQNNAIVVSRINAPYKGVIFSDGDLPVNSFWRRLDGTTGDKQTRYILGRKGFFAGLDTNGYHEHMVLPGKYKLEKMVYMVDTGSRKTIYTLQVEPQLDVQFEVKPGEAVYIGDIQVPLGSTRAKFSDKHQEAVQWFKQNHPEINKPLEKRLMTGLEGFKGFDYKVYEEVLKKLAEKEQNKLK